jgi:hypothetical protein
MTTVRKQVSITTVSITSRHKHIHQNNNQHSNSQHQHIQQNNSQHKNKNVTLSMTTF